MIDIEKNKSIFKGMASTIQKQGITELINWLDTTDFFVAPASTKYHLCENGGLCQHSLNVARFCENRFLALFHDLGKVNFYKTEMRNAKNENGQWVKVPFFTCDDSQLPLGHEMRTIFLLNQFVKLSEEETCAFMYHHGGFGNSVKGGDLACQSAWKKFPSALDLHIADLKATFLLEK